MLIEKGMGATVGIGSDRYPYTVIEVSPNYKTIKIQKDSYKPADGYNYFGNQVYEFIPDPNGPIEVWTLRKHGRYVRKGNKQGNGFYLTIGNKQAYSDPGF
jgi:hypothetical protein